MECVARPREDGDSDIYDLTWLTPDTLTVSQSGGRQLLKVRVNVTSGTCDQEVIDSGYAAGS